MNKAEQKAKELIKKFNPFTYTSVNAHNTKYENADAIHCALICVQEVKNNLPIKITQIREFWDEVENEINKMK